MTQELSSGRNWPGQHVVSLDLRSLATFRVAFGCVLLLDCLIRWIDAVAHYTDLGLLPRRVLMDSGWHVDFLSIHMASGQPWFIHSLFAIQSVCAIALLLGYRTRIVTALSWVLLISLHNRNPWLLNGGDVYARVILFWMLFLPWGQKWSLDAKAKRSDMRWWTGTLTKDGQAVQSVAAVAVLLQVCLLYWFAALPKTHPSWVADHTAIDISLRLDHLVKPFGLWFREAFAPYLGLLTWMVFEWELWGPFLLWFPFDKGQIRLVAMAVFASMHVGFELCFEIGLFPAYCLAILIVLIPSWLWDRLLHKLCSKSDQWLGDQKNDPPHTTKPRRYLVNGIQSFFLIYVACWNFGNEQFRPSLWLPDSLDFIGYTLRLDQRWNMFSPSPPYQDGWWVIKGIRRSGKETNLSLPGEPISWEKPTSISRTYLTQRRRRFMMELRATENPHLMAAFCRYLCWKANGAKRSLHEVQFVELYYMLEMTGIDGSEAKPRKLKVYRHDNFPPNPSTPTSVRLPEKDAE